MNRRTLIILLLVFGIGLPMLLEGWTLYEMIGQGLFGWHTSDGRQTARSTYRIRVGEEILKHTPQREVLERSVIRAGKKVWTYHASIRVENPTDRQYVLQLSDVTLDDGTVVEGGGEARLRPGESSVVHGRWTLPTGTSPDTLLVTGATFTGHGESPNMTRELVPLAKVPVQSRKNTSRGDTET